MKVYFGEKLDAVSKMSAIFSSLINIVETFLCTCYLPSEADFP